MVKIIKEGRIDNAPKLPWWLACQHECSACGAVYLLDSGDRVQVSSERRPDGESIAISTCPTCKRDVRTKRSTANNVRSTWDGLIERHY